MIPENTYRERGRGRERGVGGASTHSPNVCISLNYVYMYTNHLCCRPHFEVEEGPSPHFANSTDDRRDREGPPQFQHSCAPQFRRQQDMVPLLHLHHNIKNPWVLPPQSFVPVQPVKTPTPTH